MQLPLILMLLIVLSRSTLDISTSEENLQIECSYFDICLHTVSLPSNLIKMKIWVQLYFPDPLPEYPQPTPYLLLGKDRIPSDTSYDMRLNLIRSDVKSLKFRSPAFKSLTFSINGGLLNSFQMFSSYTPPSIVAVISIQYSRCDIETYAARSSDFKCKKKLTDSSKTLHQGRHYLTYPVPVHTSSLQVNIKTIKGSLKLSMNPANFGNFAVYNITNSQIVDIKFPIAETWYIIIEVEGEISYKVSTVSCEAFLHYLKCEDIFINLHKPELLGATIEEVEYKGMIHGFYVDSISSQYFVSAEGADSIEFSEDLMEERWQSVELVDGQLGYLKKGWRYVKVKANILKYAFKVIKLPLRTEDCNGQPVAHKKPKEYVCDCSQNTAGISCELLLFSYSFYLLQVAVLTISNLAMIPIVLLAYSQEFYAESVVYLANMVISIVYHCCDYKYYCLFPEVKLRRADFMLSYLSVVIAILHLAIIKNYREKSAIMMVAVIFEFFIAYFEGYVYFFDKYGVNLMQMMIIVILVTVFTYIKKIHLRSFEQSREYFQYSVAKCVLTHQMSIKWFVFSLASFISALIFKTIKSNHYYWINHSLWHVFIMASVYFIYKSRRVKSLR